MPQIRANGPILKRRPEAPGPASRQSLYLSVNAVILDRLRKHVVVLSYISTIGRKVGHSDRNAIINH